MIDLTPLDVRNKRGDFKRLMRGYDPMEVDVFLELVAERLENLVRENIQLKERSATLQRQVDSQQGREQAVQDALVTAQALRADIQTQSQREAEHLLREAESEARRILAEAEGEARARLGLMERRFEGALDGLSEIERRRQRFLKEFRSLLERELEVVDVEEDRKPLEDRAIDLDLGAWWSNLRPRDEGEDASTSGADEAPASDAGSAPEAGDETNPAPEPPAATAPRGASEEVDTASGDADSENAPGAASKASEAGGDAAAPFEAEEASDGETDTGWSDAGSTERLVVPTPPPPMPESRADDDFGLTVAPAFRKTVPTELETPSFAKRPDVGGTDREADPSYDDLAAAMEAEAMAQAGSEVVEVTGADGDPLTDVPRLEQVLAEAGAELIEVKAEGRRRAGKGDRPLRDDVSESGPGPGADESHPDR